MKKKILAFSALEAIVAVFMIAFLFLMIFLVINPDRQLAETRNARRLNDSRTILSTINQYLIDNNEVPAGIDGNLRVLGDAKSACDLRCWRNLSFETAASSCLNLKKILSPKYLTSIPVDPLWGTTDITYYAVKRDKNNRIMIYSCGSELGRDLTIIQ